MTLAVAATLPGLSERSLSSLRMHLAPVRTGRRWVGPGDRRPRELYDEGEVRRIAEALGVSGGENPYRPNRRLHNPPRASRRRSTVSTTVPEGWVTTADIRDLLLTRDGVEANVRTIRRFLDQNCNGPPVPDTADALINEAFGVLLDEAGRPRPPLRVPSEVRLVGQRVQRVYPRDAALAWIEAARGPGGEAGDQERVNFRSEVHLSGVKWRREMGRRNPWWSYIRALAPDDAQRVVVTAHRMASFIADRKKEWLAERADGTVIVTELRGALARSAR